MIAKNTYTLLAVYMAHELGFLRTAGMMIATAILCAIWQSAKDAEQNNG